MKKHFMLLLVAGCHVEGSNAERIAVSEANVLGATTIEVERDGNAFLRVNALDAAGTEVATFEQHIGDIPDLRAHLPGDDDFGSEQIITVQGETWRGISREVHWPAVASVSSSPGFRGFFNLAAVKSVLEREHVASFVPADHADRVAETRYTTFGCNASSLNTSPTVAQCCEDNWASGSSDFAWHTFFKPVSGANANLIVVRYSRGIGSCMGRYGESCSGTGCFFGPNGFSMASVWSNSGSYGVNTGWAAWFDSNANEWVYDGMCTGVQNGGGEFSGTIAGTFPTGQGCPGGASGEGAWDY